MLARNFSAALLLAAVLLAAAPSPAGPNPAVLAAQRDVPSYTPDGAMNLPANYREWVFLSSGLDINYNSPDPAEAGHSVFQNVFVNPASYRYFLQNGTWPDKTTLVLEIRGAAPKAGLDRRGETQTDVRGIEVHVKDEGHIPGKWGFFVFGTGGTASLTPHDAACYTCHEAHAAVDTTFVQFYPTLFGVARSLQTLSPVFVQQEAAPANTGQAQRP